MNKFIKVNDGFICINCKKYILPAKKTCRNHCPYCFTSLHVDNFPGDRLSKCFGIMYPVEYKISNGNIKILFKCIKCGKTHRNMSADDDEIGQLDYFIYNYKKYFI